MELVQELLALNENKNTGRVKLKPWSTEMASVIDSVVPNVEYGVGGMGGEGVEITKKQNEDLLAAFKKAEFKVYAAIKYGEESHIQSKLKPQSGLDIIPDADDKNIYIMFWTEM